MRTTIKGKGAILQKADHITRAAIENGNYTVEQPKQKQKKTRMKVKRKRKL